MAKKKKVTKVKTVKKKTTKAAKKKTQAKTSRSFKKKVVEKSPKKASPKKKAQKKSSNVDLECFLTSACMRHYNLGDDARELTTLRTYRDNYLKSFGEGRVLVSTYYQVAPQLVVCIEADPESASVYKYIYEKITEACKSIEKNAFEAAKYIYKDLVLTLQRRYL